MICIQSYLQSVGEQHQQEEEEEANSKSLIPTLIRVFCRLDCKRNCTNASVAERENERAFAFSTLHTAATAVTVE